MGHLVYSRNGIYSRDLCETSIESRELDPFFYPS